jgi:hypothetical protein
MMYMPVYSYIEDGRAVTTIVSKLASATKQSKGKRTTTPKKQKKHYILLLCGTVVLLSALAVGQVAPANGMHSIITHYLSKKTALR